MAGFGPPGDAIQGLFQTARTAAQSGPSLFAPAPPGEGRGAIPMPGEYEHWSIVITRPVRRIAQAAVVTSLVAGAVGVSHLDKSVTVSVDGKSSTVHAFGSTVGDILKKQDISIREHDVVVPAPSTKVADGQKIVVRYGRKLTVTIDGRTRDYWTTATTVSAALQELGIRADSAKLSASRSMSLGRQGLVLSVTTPKTVVVRVDGKNRTATTTGATVADVLSELQITKDADDRVKPGATTAVTPGLSIAVLRVTSRNIKETQAIAAPVTRKKDASLYVGQTKTLKAGAAGAKVVTYKVVRVDGKIESKKVVTATVTQVPVDAPRGRGQQAPPQHAGAERGQHLRRGHQPVQRRDVGPDRPV